MESKKATTYEYSIENSIQRMDAILNASNDDYVDNGNNVPSRDRLTYKNGYYVNIAALFIDLVDSSKLPDNHRRPTVAKIYRVFLSECVAIMNSYSTCKEINIHGDCVWGVFEIPQKEDINSVVVAAARLSGMIEIFNHKLEHKGLDPLAIGMGLDYGKTLMIKAGYLGSGINDVVWMGDTVNKACHLANKAGRNGRKEFIISECVFDIVNKHHQSLFNIYYDIEDDTIQYESEIISGDMSDWIEEHYYYKP